MQVFADIATEELRFHREQLDRYTYAYSLRAVVRNRDVTGVNGLPDSIRTAILTIESDADFLIEEISGSCKGPVDSSGVRMLAGTSDFLAPGCTAGFAERGLSFHLTDITGVGVELSRDYQDFQAAVTLPNSFIHAETFMSPGYGFGGFYKPLLFERFCPRNSTLMFTIRNFDSLLPATQFHSFDMAIIGKRINT